MTSKSPGNRTVEPQQRKRESGGRPSASAPKRKIACGISSALSSLEIPVVPKAKATRNRRYIFQDYELPSEIETEEYLWEILKKYLSGPLTAEITLKNLPDITPCSLCPPYSVLIKVAIWESPNKRRTVREIQNAIETRYPTLSEVYKKISDEEYSTLMGVNKKKSGSKEKRRIPWKDSIRHKLSLEPKFVQVKRPRICSEMEDYWVIHFRQVNNVYPPEPDFVPAPITSTSAVPAILPVSWPTLPPLSRFTVPPPPHNSCYVDTAPSWILYPTPYPFLPFFAQHIEHYHHFENPGIDPKVLQSWD